MRVSLSVGCIFSICAIQIYSRVQSRCAQSVFILCVCVFVCTTNANLKLAAEYAVRIN